MKTNIIFTLIFAHLTIVSMSIAVYFLSITIPTPLGNNLYIGLVGILGTLVYGFITGHNIITTIKLEKINQ